MHNQILKPLFCYITISIGIIIHAFPQGSKQTLKVSSLLSNHMVLQQSTDVNLWGQSSPGKKLVISANWGKRVTTIANAAGNWQTKLPTPKAGGPYTITVKNTNQKIVINDVLIGEVWLASGQSNMDIPLNGWPPSDTILNSRLEVSRSDYPNIRFIKVPFNISTTPLNTFAASWVLASPKTTGNFSATAYFYARRLQQELKVPIGIIQSSIGGTPVEAWTSKGYLEKTGDFNNTIEGLEKVQYSVDAWFKKWPIQDLPKTNDQWKDLDLSDHSAADVKFNDSNWATVKLPGRIDLVPAGEVDGAVWLRKEFVVSDTTTDLVLKIGSIDDMDATFINGKYIGGLVGAGFATTAREMVVPRSLLVKGVNVIAIRVIDTGGQGIVRGPMSISNAQGAITSIEGDWRSRLVAELLNGKFYTYGLLADISKRPDISKLNSNSPTVLFNAMINPLVNYTIKGAIWYQGESNVGRADQYKRLFPNMIEDWRDKWGYQFPFYFVQLAPFIYSAADQKEQSQKLRNAQRYALKLPKTGMVSTLDIGYLKTAHPPFKQAVGDRLARFALANDYGKKLIASGPLYKNSKVLGNKIIIEFGSIGSGLRSSKALDNFEIAGEDKVYVKAQAEIVNKTVVVTSPLVNVPLYVRYAWSDSSSATLFNNEGLPASTFTSEE